MSVKVPTSEDLKRLRREAGYTQKELARKAGVSQSLIARIEAGTVDPRLSTLKKILDALVRGEEEAEAAKFMHSPVIHVKTSDPLKKVVDLMERHGISQLPVLERGRVVGSVDEATLLRALSQSKSPGALFGQSVKRFMIDPFPVVGPSTPMSEVLAHLQDKPAVLVVDKGWIAGIITKIDVIASLRAR